MNDESMTKEQLLDALNMLRKEVDRFRKVEAERERYVKELKERARFLAGVLEASPIVFTITRRKDGRFLLVNPAHGRESGYSPEEVLGKTSLELNMYVNKADRDAFVKILEEAGELNNFDVQYRNKDGSVRDVLLYARPLVYAGEECMLTASLSITERNQAEQKIAKYRDHLKELVKERTAQLESEITERKRGEEALRESEEKYRSMMEAMDEAVYICSPDYRVEYVNPAMVKRTGWDVIGELCYKVINGLDDKCPWCVHNRVLQGESCETDIESPKDGRSYNISHSPIFHEDGSISKMTIFRDITERKEVDEALRESEEHYRTLIKAASRSGQGIVLLQDRDHVEAACVFANDGATDITGYSQDELAQMSWLNILHPLDRAVAEDRYKRRMHGEANSDVVEVTILEKGGKELPIELVSIATELKGKTALVVFFREIGDRKQAEDALRKSEEQYRTLMDNLPVAVYRNTPGPDGKFLMANPAFCKMFRFKNEEEVKKVSVADFYANSEERKQFSDKIMEQGVVENDERTLVKRDGTPAHASMTASVVYGKDGEVSHFDCILLDVTEQKRLEAELRQAQKMEAIATLAGGVAHEFNNALMGIMGNIELLKMDLTEDEGRDKSFEAMKGSGHRMSRLTDQLLAYAEGGKYDARDLKLDDFTIETLPILQHDLSPEVRVETRFQKVSYIRADHTQMQMVLSAILTNSNEAIEDKGLIRIAAENKDIDEGFTKHHRGLKPGSYVCLTIEDDGKGMDEETRSGIFDPFFTTKFQGRGMGMAAVYGIVKNHDGWIYVDSELGKGTVVCIYLPAIEAKEEVKEDVVLRPMDELATGEGTILVIEDEEPLVELFRQILERLGYRVLMAKTGKEAVGFANTFDGQIDLALLDIKLPDMDGGRVYPLIMDARPDLKVIVCSGYSIHGPAQDILDAGAEGFIQKPFSIAPFAEKLKEVLEGK